MYFAIVILGSTRSLLTGLTTPYTSETWLTDRISALPSLISGTAPAPYAIPPPAAELFARSRRLPDQWLCGKGDSRYETRSSCLLTLLPSPSPICMRTTQWTYTADLSYAPHPWLCVVRNRGTSTASCDKGPFHSLPLQSISGRKKPVGGQLGERSRRSPGILTL